MEYKYILFKVNKFIFFTFLSPRNPYYLPMLTKGKTHFILSLSDRKTRYEEGYFIVEGKKSILEAIDARMEIREIFAVDPGWVKDVPVTVITEKELRQISTLSTNHDGLAIVKMRPCHVDDRRHLARNSEQDFSLHSK